MKKAADERRRLRKKIEDLELLETKAQKANDARLKRQAELKKKATLAKLKAEELRQKQLDEKKRKLEEIEKERLRQKLEIEQKKREEEDRIASLKKTVLEKRENLGGTTLASLSPEKTITEMIHIDTKIKEIKNSFRNELITGVKAIIDRVNSKFIQISGVMLHTPLCCEFFTNYYFLYIFLGKLSTSFLLNPQIEHFF